MGSRLRKNVNLLYECFCEVSDGDGFKEPSVTMKYPENYNNEEELKVLPKFTYPCEFDRSIVHHFSYVLTSLKSKYTYCFCRYDPKKKTSYVVMSHLPWHEIFYKMLNTAAALDNINNSEFLSFLIACRVKPPMPGQTLNVTFNAGQSVFLCECPNENQLPTIPGNINLTEYFSAVNATCMVGLWAALLYERRVAVVASKPSRLSATVQAANATLYPMSWQHIFIPILPGHLVDYLLAPMPFLIGVPRSVMDSVRLSEIGDVVILDVDKNEIKNVFNDLDALPSEVVSSLKKELSNKNALGDAVSRAFIRALVYLIGSYRDAIRIENGELITFNRNAFVKTRRNMEPFLEDILKTQNFNQERLDLLNSGRGFSDEFEIECNNYAEKTGGGSGLSIKQQYKDWLKTMKKGGGAVFKSVKDKANPAVRSAVLTVRQGGRNVRSAVQGFKIKMPHKHSSRSAMNNLDDSRLSYGSPGGSAAAGGSDDSLRSTTSSRSGASACGPPRDLYDHTTTHTGGHPMHPVHNTLPSRSSATLPPRLPARPSLPSRYPIVPTANLLEATTPPQPPPRSGHLAPGLSKFYSSLTNNREAPAAPPHALPIHFTQVEIERPKGRPNMAERKLSTWKVESRPPPRSIEAPPMHDVGSRTRAHSRGSVPNDGGPAMNNTGHPRVFRAVNTEDSLPKKPAVLKATISAPSTFNVPTPSLPLDSSEFKHMNSRSKEATESEPDLIQLDSPLISFDEYDPPRSTPRPADPPSTDIDLLQEYGLDFSRFGFDHFGPNLLSDIPPNEAPACDSEDSIQTKSSVPKEWTTFN